VTGGADQHGGRRLLLVGNIPVDLTQRVPHLPRSGEDLRSGGPQVVAPGVGFHVVHAAWRSGLHGRFAGVHGTGPFGDQIRAALARIECEVVQPARKDRDSAVVVVLVDAAGERTFVSPADSVPPFDTDTLESLQPAPGDLVYVSGYSLGLGDASTPLAEWVGVLPRHLLVFCDLGPWGAEAASDLLEPVLRRVDWLACNAPEASRVTGETQGPAAADALQRRTGSARVLVRVGGQGCWLAERDAAPILVPTRARRDVVDSNGAGDAHSGAFLAALAGGRSARKAVEHANAVAGRVVSSTPGAPARSGFGAELVEEG
jgi:sugar/nucleoside kinase (ribokinase family)